MSISFLEPKSKKSKKWYSKNLFHASRFHPKTTHTLTYTHSYSRIKSSQSQVFHCWTQYFLPNEPFTIRMGTGCLLLKWMTFSSLISKYFSWRGEITITILSLLFHFIRTVNVMHVVVDTITETSNCTHTQMCWCLWNSSTCKVYWWIAVGWLDQSLFRWCI